MIELSKSSRVAYASLRTGDREKVTSLYNSEDEIGNILKAYDAKELRGMKGFYLLKLSEQLRAIVQVIGQKIIILEITRRDTLQRMFSSVKDKETVL